MINHCNIRHCNIRHCNIRAAIAGCAAFLSLIVAGEGIAKASNYANYANGNLASQEFIDGEIKGNGSIYPDEETLGRLYVKDVYEGQAQRLVPRAWTKIVTGQ